jgi:hypothetical protein
MKPAGKISGVTDMSTISEIRIVGIDQTRPPRLRKENYIDLYFKLSQKPPEDWCEDFNQLGRRINPSPKIKPGVGESVDTYVNDMTLIPAHLAELKKLIVECNEQYIEKIRLKELKLAEQNSALQGADGEQNRLNQIIESLDFDS